MDRLDELLDAYLETGEIPQGASAEERQEIERLGKAAGTVRAARLDMDAEADASAPVVRARFERAVMNSRNAEATARSRSVAEQAAQRSAPGVGFWKVAGAAAAALAVVAVIAIIARQLIFSGVDTVAALEPGDFTQVEGVVTRVDGRGDEREVRVATPLGQIVVEAGAGTAVIDHESEVELAAIEPGMPIAVGGIVSPRRRITAQTLAIVADVRDRPVQASVQRFRLSDVGLTGTVVAFSVPEDGRVGRLIVRVDSGRQYLIPTETASVLRLLAGGEVLGARVRVASEAEAGRYVVELLEEAPVEPTPDVEATITVPPGRPDRPGEGSPGLVAVSGIVVAGERGELTIATLRGRVAVVISERTRIVAADSGLEPERVRQGEALVGLFIAVRGGLDGETNAVVADVLVVGSRDGSRPARGR